MEDRDIIELYFARDEKAIVETARRYKAYCFTVAHNVLGNREDAEECVNDSYMGAWNTIPPQRPANFRAYLGKIVRNAALKKWRGRNTAKRGGELALAYEELAECLPSVEDCPAQSLEATELTRCINAFISTLRDGERRLFVGRYWYFYSVADLAKSLGISQSNAKVSLHRLREKLRTVLEKEGYVI